MYIDKNDLYGAARCEVPTTKQLRTLNRARNSITSQKISTFLISTQKQIKALIYFQVDLHYPSDIHHKTADFPLDPEAAQVKQDILPPFMEHLYQ